MQVDGLFQFEVFEWVCVVFWFFVDYVKVVEFDDVYIFVMSVVCEVKNCDLLFDQLLKMGFDFFEVVSGEEEVVFGVCVVVNVFDFDDVWVMDLGGGLVQILFMKGGQFVCGQVFLFGVVCFFDCFLLWNFDVDGKLLCESFEVFDVFIDDELGEIFDVVVCDDLLILVMGGMVCNFVCIVQEDENYFFF